MPKSAYHHLSNIQRQQIATLAAKRFGQEITAGEVCRQLGINYSTLKHICHVGTAVDEKTLDLQANADACSCVHVNQMRPAGLEPATSWFEATRSIQLRYGRSNEPKRVYRQITSGETVRQKRWRWAQNPAFGRRPPPRLRRVRGPYSGLPIPPTAGLNTEFHLTPG